MAADQVGRRGRARSEGSRHPRRDSRCRSRPAAPWTRSPAASRCARNRRARARLQRRCGSRTAASPRKHAPRRRQRHAAARTQGTRLPRRRTVAAAKKKAKASRKGPPVEGARPAPLPAFVPPALTVVSTKAPDAPNWVHEIKFDGYRMQARLERRTHHARARGAASTGPKNSRASPMRWRKFLPIRR